MFGVMNPWLLLAALVAVLASFGTGYYKGGKAAEAEQTEKEVLILQAAQAAQEAAAQQIAQIKINHTTIQRKVEREILEKPVYRDCKHDANGLRLINAALANRPDSTANLKLPEVSGGTQ